MKKILLISSTLLVISALLTGCDEQSQQQQAAQKNHDLELSKKPEIKQQMKTKKVIKAVAPKVNKSIQQTINEIKGSDVLELEENVLQKPVQLDFSLHLGIQELNSVSYAQGVKQQLVLPGIFNFENISATNVEMEAHFSGPHNENKEQETTPDGVGVKFKIGF